MIRLNESPSFLEPCIQSKIVYPLSLKENSLHRELSQETSPAVATSSLANLLWWILKPLCEMPETIRAVPGLGVLCAGRNVNTSARGALALKNSDVKSKKPAKWLVKGFGDHEDDK